MELGGFVYRCRHKASFLGSDLGHTTRLGKNVRKCANFFPVFPEKTFIPLPRDHDLFRTFFRGLPKNEDLKIQANQKRLPETV